MKTTLLLLGMGAGVSMLPAQTNAPVAAPVAATQPASPPVGAPTAPSGGLAATTPITTPSAGSKPLLLEPKPPLDGIEGKKFNYTGAAPRAIKGGGFRGVLQLFNPFAKLSDAEKRQPTGPTDRPLPRGFVDDRTMQPEGLKILSVEQK